MSTDDAENPSSPPTGGDEEEPVSSPYNGRASGNLRVRSSYLSNHRQTMNRISVDLTHSVIYPVPLTKANLLKSQKVLDAPEEEAPPQPSGEKPFYVTLKTTVNQYVEDHKPRDRDEWIEFFLPAWGWLRTYDYRTKLLKDCVAGLTVGVMVVPQGMSYAKLAGLPVQYGLYTAFVPVFAYSVFGSSRQLAVGPVAIVSLLLSSGLTQVMSARGISTKNPIYNTQYAIATIQTSFMVGLIYIFLGLLNMGWITIFLSHAVISGFTSGASWIIGMGQVKYLFGVNTPNSSTLWQIIIDLCNVITQFNWKTFVMGLIFIGQLLLFKHVGKKYPRLKVLSYLGPLTACVIGLILVYAFNLDKKGIPVVGKIPAGFPPFTASWWSPIQSFDLLIIPILTITIVGFMESIAIAKQIAARHKYEIDASRELMGLGMANFLGSMFSAYPVTGSFSRSAVNNDSGAQSGLAGTVTAFIVMFVLLLLTSVFQNLPLCILGAIIIAGVISLFDYPEAIKLWKVDKFDFCVWMSAFLGVLLFGAEIGIGISVGVSVLIVLYEAAFPRTSVLGRLPGTSVYRSIKQYPEAEQYNGIVICRIDAPLFFANAQNVRDKLRKYRLAAEAQGVVKYLIIELSPVSHIDTSALHLLEDMVGNFKSRNQGLLFSSPNVAVMDRFVKSGFVDRLGSDHFFSCAHDAVTWCLNQLDADAISLHNGTVDSDESPDDGDDIPKETDDIPKEVADGPKETENA